MSFVCHLRQLPTATFLSVNRFLYLLGPRDKVEACFEREGPIHFEISQDWLIVSDESTKILDYYNLNEVISTRHLVPKHSQ